MKLVVFLPDSFLFLFFFFFGFVLERGIKDDASFLVGTVAGIVVDPP